MEESKNNYFFQSAHTLVTKGINLTLGFISGIILARYLGPEGRGTYALFLVVPNLIMPLASMGLRQSTAYLIGQKQYNDKEIYSNMLSFYIINLVISVIIVIFYYQHLGFFNKYGYILPFLFLMVLPFNLFRNYSSGLLLAKKRIANLNILLLTYQFLFTLLLFIFLYILKWHIKGAAYALFFANFAVFIIILYWTRHYTFTIPKLNPIARELLIRGIFYAIALFVLSMNYRIDVIMLGRIKSETSVGIYSVGVSITELLKQIPLACGLVLFSRIINWDSVEINDSIYKVTKLTRLLFLITILCSILMIITSHWLIPILYGNKFLNSYKVILNLIPGIVFLSVFIILQFFTAGQGRPQTVLYAFVPGLIINIFLNLLLIKKYDYIGAAISSSISYFISTMLYILIFNKIYRTDFKSFFLLRKSDFKILRNYLK